MTTPIASRSVHPVRNRLLRRHYRRAVQRHARMAAVGGYALIADSITVDNLASIAPSVQALAGYLDGAWADFDAIQAAYGSSHVLFAIVVTASDNRGLVLDVENGDATPGQAPDWVVLRRVAGIDPWVYCAESSLPAVRAAFAAAGVPEPHYWVAAYPGEGPYVTPPAVAHQYASVGPYDLSVVDPSALPGAAPPAPAPAPIPASQEAAMLSGTQPVIFQGMHCSVQVNPTGIVVLKRWVNPSESWSDLFTDLTGDLPAGFAAIPGSNPQCWVEGEVNGKGGQLMVLVESAPEGNVYYFALGNAGDRSKSALGVAAIAC